MRLSPKALTRTRASVGLGEGFGMEELRNRAEAGPVPFLISGEELSGFLRGGEDAGYRLHAL